MKKVDHEFVADIWDNTAISLSNYCVDCELSSSPHLEDKRAYYIYRGNSLCQKHFSKKILNKKKARRK